MDYGLNQPIFGTKKVVILSIKKVGLKVAEKNFNINIIFSKTAIFMGFTSAIFLVLFFSQFLYTKQYFLAGYFDYSNRNKRHLHLLSTNQHLTLW